MPRNLRALLCAVAFLSVPVAVSAQSLQPVKPEEVGLSSQRLAKIAEVFNQEIKDQKIPGAVIMIARKGKVAYHEAFGAQDKSAERTMAKDSIFRIYSMTKALASVGAMILVEDGKVQLTDPVAKFLPEFKNVQVSTPRSDGMGQLTYGLVPADRQPTIQDLLRHTAGLAYGEITGNARVKDGLHQRRPVHAWRRLLLDRADARRVHRQDRRDAARVPAGHDLGIQPCGRRAGARGREGVRASACHEFLDERLFKPLKMTDTGFSVPAGQDGAAVAALRRRSCERRAEQADRRVEAAEERLKEAPARFRPRPITCASARCCSTAASSTAQRILSRTTVALMASDHLPPAIRQTVQPGEQLLGVQGYSFGLGFAVRKEQGVSGVHGSPGEFTWAGYAGTYFWIDPKEQLVGVLMTQAPGPSRPYYRRMLRALTYQAIVD